MKMIVLGLVATGMVLGMVSCKGGGSGGSGGTVSGSKIATFAKRCGLLIPPSAKGTDWRRMMLGDGEMMLKLEMPVGDLGAFLTKSGLDGELGNTTHTSPATSYLRDFLPAHPKKFREGQKDLGGGEFLNVLVDEDSPTTTVVYLKWFGT